MNLPNKITFSRILLVPIFMIFIIPIPEYVVHAELLISLKSKMILYNDFINSTGRYIAAIFFIIASGTDGVDGYIARKRKQVTRLGKFLDPIADKLLVTAALIALISNGVISGWSAMVIIGREFIVTGFRLVAAGEGIIISASKLGKLKMVTQTVAISIALLNNFPLNIIYDLPYDSYAMFIAVLITVYSGIDYVRKNVNVINEK